MDTIDLNETDGRVYQQKLKKLADAPIKIFDSGQEIGVVMSASEFQKMQKMALRNLETMAAKSRAVSAKENMSEKDIEDFVAAL